MRLLSPAIRLIEWLKDASRKRLGARKEDLSEALEWTVVESSCVAAVMYDPAEASLFVRFTDQAEYVYYRVHPDTAISMLYAVSKGRFMWREVRGKFVYLRTKPRIK